MSGSEDYESGLPQFDPEEFRVTVVDGLPVLELPNGQEIRLRVHVTEWTHERPNWGESVPMDVEVDYDDFAWWSLYPERSDVMRGDKSPNFPQLSIEPEILGGGDGAE